MNREECLQLADGFEAVLACIDGLIEEFGKLEQRVMKMEAAMAENPRAGKPNE